MKTAYFMNIRCSWEGIPAIPVITVCIYVWNRKVKLNVNVKIEVPNF